MLPQNTIYMERGFKRGSSNMKINMKKRKLIQIIREEISTLLSEIYEGIADDIAAADKSAAQKTPRGIHKQKEKLVKIIRSMVQADTSGLKVDGESPSPETLVINISLKAEPGGEEESYVMRSFLNSALELLALPQRKKDPLSLLERLTKAGRRKSDASKYHNIAGGMILDNFEEVYSSFPLIHDVDEEYGIPALRFSWDEDTFNLLARARDAESSTLFPGSAGARQAAASWEPPKPGDVQYRWAGDPPDKDD